MAYACKKINDAAYKRGLWDGVKMTVEGCYNSSGGAAVLNGDTGHALLCEGVDTGMVDPAQGIRVLRASGPTDSAGEPESEQERKKKEADPRQT